MVLSNLSNNMDVESRTMVTMGDTLGALGLGKPHGVRVGCVWRNPAFTVARCAVFSASRGLLDAAHFCYLMAQLGLGVYTRKTTKLVLIGSNHR